MLSFVHMMIKDRYKNTNTQQSNEMKIAKLPKNQTNLHNPFKNVYLFI